MSTTSSPIEPKKEVVRTTLEAQRERPRSPFEQSHQYRRDAQERSTRALHEIADVEAVAKRMHDAPAVDRLKSLANQVSQEESLLREGLDDEGPEITIEEEKVAFTTGLEKASLKEEQQQWLEKFHKQIQEVPNEERDYFAQRMIEDVVFQIKDRIPFDPEDLSLLSEIAQDSTSFREKIISNLSNYLSPKYAEQLLDPRKQQTNGGRWHCGRVSWHHQLLCNWFDTAATWRGGD